MNLFSLGTRVLGILIAVGLPAFYSASFVVSESPRGPVPQFESITGSSELPIPDREAGVEYSAVTFQSLASGRTLIQYSKNKDGKDLGRFFRQSFGGTRTYTPEERIEPVPGISEGDELPGIFLLERGLAAAVFSGSDFTLSYRTDQERSWGPPSKVNDELASVLGSAAVYQGPDGSIYTIWIDIRQGFRLIFFSTSSDGGRTWSANKPVEFDFREGDQWNPQMVIGAGGRLLVFWEDWRDRKTLVDIRYAWSDDGGRHWVPGGKVNDDSKHVWQLDFSAAASGNEIYVAFSDFRDPGEAGDNDWNIYFARSDNNGTSFEPNVRLNDIVQGIDKDPRLAIAPGGEIYCFWRTGRNTLFGQVAASYSPDGGRHWSPSAVIGGDALSDLTGIAARPFKGKKMLVSWRESDYASDNYKYRVVEKSMEAAVELRDPDPASSPLPLKAEKGDLIFADDFSGAGGWRESGGLWLNVNGTYMGTAPGDANFFVSFMPVSEPESYILEGRFLLDPVAHYISAIYLRSRDNGRRQISISNQFRVGAWISIKDDDSEGPPRPIGGVPIAEQRFPFQRNHWYDFRLVVTPSQIDYYVDGRRMLGVKLEKELEPGSIGLGGFTSAPTYFDDISVHSIKR